MNRCAKAEGGYSGRAAFPHEPRFCGKPPGHPDPCGDWFGPGIQLPTIRDSGRANLEVVTANGFETPTWDNFPSKLLLVFTEVTEAEAAVRFAEPDQAEARTDIDTLEEELADIAIRITGLLFGLAGEKWSNRGSRGFYAHPYQPIEALLRPIRDSLTDAAEAWRRDGRPDAIIALEIALAKTAGLASALGIDLPAEMEKKRIKNAGRPKLHGKARPEG